MKELKQSVQAWQDEVFPDRTLMSCLLKLKEEIKEYTEAETEDEEFKEYADIIIVCWSLEKFENEIGTLLTFFNFIFYDLLDIKDKYTLKQAIADKLAINKARKWKFENGVYRHVDN